MELLTPRDWSAVKKSVDSAVPYPHFCIDNFLTQDFANEVFSALPSYEECLANGKSFNALNERGKVQLTDSGLFPPSIKRLNDLLASAEFLKLVGELLSIPDLCSDPLLSGGGIHQTKEGGRLDVHVDFNFNKELGLYRRANVLLYLNKGWQHEYGGNFEIWDTEVENCFGSYSPVFNRCCGFATSEISYHGVTPISSGMGLVRKSFATYYYAKEPPTNMGDLHSTIFKPRPSEKFRANVLAPLENSRKFFRRWVKKW